MKKSKKLQSLSQTDAMSTEPSSQPTTLDQIWGDTGLNKYNTLDEQSYEQELLDMAKVDLQKHAEKHGLVPIDDVRTLRARLLREFRRHVGMYSKPVENKQGNKLSKDVLRILSEGK